MQRDLEREELGEVGMERSWGGRGWARRSGCCLLLVRFLELERRGGKGADFFFKIADWVTHPSLESLRAICVLNEWWLSWSDGGHHIAAIAFNVYALNAAHELALVSGEYPYRA